jgi:hypothetical protein
VTRTLQERLQDAKNTLDQVNVALGRNRGALPIDVETSSRNVVGCRSEIDHWLTMIEARTAVWQLLDGLEGNADADDLVHLEPPAQNSSTYA